LSDIKGGDAVPGCEPDAEAVRLPASTVSALLQQAPGKGISRSRS
jgi:hypothetical protein